MKSKNTLTLLTLAAASLLTACGSGGGKAPETMPAPAPKLEQDKAPEKGKEQGDEKVPEVAPPASQAPERKPEAPKRDNKPKQPEVRKTDAEVFDKLRLESVGSGVVLDNLFHLVLKEGTRKIDLGIVSPHDFIGTPKVETLRDLDGTLVGYYGYARVSEQKKDEARPDGEKIYAADRHFFLQSSDSSQLRLPVSLGNVTYKGKMFYQYNNDPNRAAEADVSATYFGQSKRLSMTISGQEGQWRLQDSPAVSSPETASVHANGLVAGYLAFKGNEEAKFKPNGTFTGGFYGKNGSVLTGQAQFNDKDKGWKGVIGATAAPAK
ncbi:MULTISPECIES: hypothetical protein [unclassified Neisseria]|uniref:transferrin-binding protein-like solute binding protein n=1 Tax=unclassified Neisseria TaxID=2623750 RepID=UPI0026659596|nr:MULTISPECIES: hypothetical protein [unclassified Neisseria]MDO1510152.1 hypothetical protein [Neisseria sp. MVDL19-042950]MDO1516728.1 hypothetical protein [Neisseria sp. MVDL18-041461]MDO1563875.1 hypothetical protein [Neisseria sp. MVDL20-010259]